VSAPPPAAADPAHAVTPTELAARLASFGPFEHEPRLAVAVSGGCDSMALALLAAAWARERRGAVLALVVDHGLRAASAAEAARVTGWLAGRGIASRVLRWEGPKPTTGIQAAARAARYALLEEACRAHGILHLLLAHHADDQAETVALRAERASGPCGRAGMAAVVERRGLRLLRPLLAVGKARLAATLREAGQPWLEDPSNRDPRFRRGALRRLAPSPRWWEEGGRCAQQRAALDGTLARLFARSVRPHPLGQVTLDPAAFAALTPSVRAAALTRVLLAVRGHGYPVAGAAVRSLAERLAGPRLERRVTLAGCVVEPWRGAVVVAREPGRITEHRLLTSGALLLWDGRFEVAYRAGPGPLRLALLGEAGRGGLPMELRAGLRAAGVATAAVASLPGLWAGDALMACPPLQALGLASRGSVEAIARLRGGAALAGAAFAGVNVVSKAQHLIYPADAGMKPMPGTLEMAPG